MSAIAAVRGRRGARASSARTATRSSAPGRARFALDGGVALTAGSLILLGVVMSYSTTAAIDLDLAIPPLFQNHMLALAIGLGCTIVAMAIPIRVWRKAALPLWIVTTLLLVLTYAGGIEVNGARRWLELGIRFQPVEIVKFTTLLAVAAVVAPRDGRRDLSPRRASLALGVFALPPVLLLLGQPDLGNAVLLLGLVALVLIVAGRPLRTLVLPGLITAGAVALYVVSNDYARRRFEGFLDPWTREQTSGFQLVQSFVAFGQGGLTGAGVGNGRQKLDYLFGAHTDFVLALIAEELGLIGVLAVLAAFALLLISGCRIALRAGDRFGLLLAFSMTALLCLPALVNGAVVMGLVPTKGLTLPFLSYGGTSLVMCCTALGVLLGIARQSGRRGRRHPAGSGRRASTVRVRS